MRVLLVDHHDSYVHNLYDQLAQICGVPPAMVQAGSLPKDGAEVDATLSEFDCVVLSPGPGNPMCSEDIGGTMELIAAVADRRLPLLGVCLGHQALGLALGGVIRRLRNGPVHGIRSIVRLEDSALKDPLFEGMPAHFLATRYHSLGVEVDTPLPVRFGSLAWSESDTELMALRAHWGPHYGLQFHPESVGTGFGWRLIENFIKLAHATRSRLPRPTTNVPEQELSPRAATTGHGDAAPDGLEVRCESWSLDDPIDSECLFTAINQRKSLDAVTSGVGAAAGGSEAFSPIFWLDSASGPLPGFTGRFSFIGGGDLLHGDSSWSLVRYDACHRRVQVDGPGAKETLEALTQSAVAGPPAPKGVSLHALIADDDTFFDALERVLERFRSRTASSASLPFDFLTGAVGFFGYGLGFTEPNMVAYGLEGCPAEAVASFEDAVWLISARVLVVDHVLQKAWALERREVALPSLVEGGTSRPAWVDELQARVDSMRGSASRAPGDAGEAPCLLSPTEPPRCYGDNVSRCLEEIVQGNSYELCLTTEWTSAREQPVQEAPDAVYLRLRKVNPSPYGIFLAWRANAAILGSSPERFLCVGPDGMACTRPIKGTRRRGATPEEDRELVRDLQDSEKDLAENLMILDLSRNDLAQVSVPGTVVVRKGPCGSPAIVESYATVHQLVATATGRLLPGLAPMEAVKALFPPGSMTGAPKRRSMQILHRLESRPRGSYAGASGFLSACSRALDLCVNIRTIEIRGGRVHLGTGGAIVAMSSPEEETAEMVLKSLAPRHALLGTHASEHLSPLLRRPRASAPAGAPALLETMLWQHDGGIWLGERHHARIAASSRELGFPAPPPLHAWEREARSQAKGARALRLRLSLGRDGHATFTSSPMPLPKGDGAPSPCIVFDVLPALRSGDPALRHKTTWRDTYDSARRRTRCVDLVAPAQVEPRSALNAEWAAWAFEGSDVNPGGDRPFDVVLYNERLEVCETSIANLAVEIDNPGESPTAPKPLATPPLHCGLLPGTLRAELLAEGRLCEQVISLADFAAAAAAGRGIYCLNSVRGLYPVQLVGAAGVCADGATRAPSQNFRVPQASPTAVSARPEPARL